MVNVYETEIKLHGIKENFVEGLGVGCFRKDIKYAKVRTESDFTYSGMFLTKDELKKVYTTLKEEAKFFELNLDKDPIKLDGIIHGFSDGSCTSRNEKVKKSSYGMVRFFQDFETDKIIDYHEGSDTQPEGTNNMGELSGMISLLSNIVMYIENNELHDKNLLIKLTSDSEYVIKGYTSHLPLQIKRGWKDTTGKTIKYKEEWQIFKDLIDYIVENTNSLVQFCWVKGHKLPASDVNFCKDIDNIHSILEDGEVDDHTKYFMNERCDILAKGILGK